MQHVAAGQECSGLPASTTVRDQTGLQMRCYAGWWLVDEPRRRYARFVNKTIEPLHSYPWE